MNLMKHQAGCKVSNTSQLGLYLPLGILAKKNKGNKPIEFWVLFKFYWLL